ncbi:MAG: DUF503 domain-containing protein [Desulfosalsimonadaceae bacterium]
MVIGTGTVTLNTDHCRSLKEKRKITKSILARVKNTYNVSIAEVDLNDVHTRARIGFAFAGNDRRKINSKIDKMFEFIENLSLAEIIDTQVEILTL